MSVLLMTITTIEAKLSDQRLKGNPNVASDERQMISSAPIGLMKGTPKQIGQIEFDVEVEEEPLKAGQKAPHVDIIGSVSDGLC